MQDAGRIELARTVKEQQDKITVITKRNRTLEGILSVYSKEEEQADNAVMYLSSPFEEGKLRMYLFHKLGFLDKSIWNDELTYDQIAMFLRKVLGGKAITQNSSECYAKLFNFSGNTQLKQYEADNEHKVLNYLKSICPDTDFHKGKFVNNIMK